MIIIGLIILVLGLIYAVYSALRVACRIYFIDKLKYETSYNEHQDIGVNRATKKWFHNYEKRYSKNFFKFLFDTLMLNEALARTLKLESFYRECVK